MITAPTLRSVAAAAPDEAQARPAETPASLRAIDLSVPDAGGAGTTGEPDLRGTAPGAPDLEA